MINPSAKERVEEYLKIYNIRINRFYGKCITTDKGFLVIGDILSKEEGNLLLREDGDRLQLFTGRDNTFFEADKFYEFSIYVPAGQSKKELVVVLDLKIEPPIEININPYQEIVRLRYERLDNPEANRMIANLMREIGKGLYSSKQRMIFELLQNADDTPAGNEVSFHIDAYYDYLLIMHNGLPFNQDDVEAITSAAESTKRNDRKKTGYKGIGFKSVFTDSEEVIIRSGGFLFTFKRNHIAYKNFDSFYFGKKRYADYPILLEEDKLKYARQRKSFNGNTDIPWQLIPIWSEYLPKALENSRLAAFNNNVGFAIKFGREKVEEYLEAIANFADSPHFMLFLRHVNIFKSFKNAITIRKSGENPVLIERIAQDGNNLKLTYLKKEIDDIKVNDEALAEEGIIIYKRQRENEYGEISHYFSSDIEGKKPIESIPPKLASFDETLITFAVPVIDKIIRAEPSYLLGKSFSSFYTFLPMEEMRISLPFLINADFVPSADRESLQGDSEWNEYIIAKIAYNHLKWVKEIAENSIANNEKQPEYLSLLLKELLPDDFSIRMLIKRYNYTYTKSIKEVDFIISDKNLLCKTSEILIDTSGIATLLGAEFFYSISNTKKHLPNADLNTSYLLYDYLEIEKFTSKKLVDLLIHSGNKESLREVIALLKIEEYIEFLSWFNEFSYINGVSNHWLLTMPIIRLNNEVVSLTEALFKGQYIFKTQRIQKIEIILAQIGFDLSEIYIDDQKYQYLNGVLKQQDSYLKTDLKLYEHIAAAKDLSKLNAIEKNTLITFFESLDDVGKAKYAKALPLFKSKKHGEALKPLNSLISNSCLWLPDWLSDFVIDREEENSLSATFQIQLLKEKDLLGKLFCNAAAFNEVIKNINSGNIEEFYTYLLKLLNNKPEETKIDFSLIPWVFIEACSKFVLASTVYWPESITRLASAKYASVKSVFEIISVEKLPHFSALQIKGPFALGSKELKLNEITPYQNSFDAVAVNDFLDWAETNGERDFLNHLSFYKVDDKFSMVKVWGTFCYYTTYDSLITFIQASAINTKLNLFPKELYTKERSKIGLLEGAPLLKYLIENGQATPFIAKFVQFINEPKLSLQYLELLTDLNIESSKSYTADDSEFKILKLVSNQIINDAAKLDHFSEKIILDGVKLLEKAVSADVRMYDDDNGQFYQFQSIELSDILPAYKGKTYPVSEIMELFIEFRDNESLKKIFKAKRRGTKRIYKDLIELKLEAYNAAQTFFLSYYQSLYPTETILKDKIFFTLNPVVNKEAYEKELHQFLDYCLKENFYIAFVSQRIIKDFNTDLLIADDECALEKELLPEWLRAWLECNIGDEVQSFIAKIGVKNANSPVVQLRKGMLGDITVNMDAARGGITEPELLVNSFEWLLTKYKDQQYTASLLKPLFERAIALKISIEALPLPIPTDISCKIYHLFHSKEKIQYHLIWDGWGIYKNDVWNYLKETNQKFIDELLPVSYIEHLKPIKLTASSEIDKEKIFANLRDCNLSFYRFWLEKDNYIIKTFMGSSLPKKVTYGNETVKSFYDGYFEKIDNFYVVAESVENALPHSIREFIPDFFDRLNSWKSDFENNRPERELTTEEEEAVMKLYDGVVPEEFRKNLNLAALASALVYLDNQGFDVFKANKQLSDTHEYAQLTPVYKAGVQYTVMCRSARLGLLYLTKKAWDRLDNPNDPNVILFADKGYGETDLFRTKQDVLDVNKDNPTDFQLIRIESRANAIDLDKMLQGKFEDASRLWIIFRLKRNEHFDKLFFEKPETNNNPLSSVNVKTDDTGGY